MLNRPFVALLLISGALVAPPGCTCAPQLAAQRVVPLQHQAYGAEVKAALLAVEELEYGAYRPSEEHESFGIFPHWGPQVDVSPAYHSFRVGPLAGKAYHDDPGRNVHLELWPRLYPDSRRRAKALAPEAEAMLDQIEAGLSSASTRPASQ